MANRKAHGAKIKLSDEQVQNVITFLMMGLTNVEPNGNSEKISNKDLIIAAAKWFNVNSQMIVSLTKGQGRFKSLMHTENHIALVAKFKKVKKEPYVKKGYVNVSHNRKRVIFTDKQMTEIFDLFDLGFDYAQIADSYNCSAVTIFRNMKKHPRYVSKSVGRKKKKENEIPEVEVIPVAQEVIEHSIDNLINLGIQESLKKILVNPEFYSATINQINSQFFTIQEASQQEIDNVIIFRSFTILQRILSVSTAELQAVYLTLTLKENQ